MPAGTHTNNRRNATDIERSLAFALITGAFGIIVGVLWAAFGFFDKVNKFGQIIVVSLGIIGCLLLVLSIALGGIGIAYGVRPGAWNLFDLQAKLGIFALIVLLSAPIAGYSFKADVDVYTHLNALKTDVGSMKATIDARLELVNHTVGLNIDETSLLRQEIDKLKAHVGLIYQGPENSRGALGPQPSQGQQ